MRRFFEPASAPIWLKQVLVSIRAALGDVYDVPLRLFQTTTANRPTAADYKSGLIYDTTDSRPAFSDGASWFELQPYDATLVAWAAYNTNGLVTQTDADTFTGRTIAGTANEITVTNGSGVAGNPTLSLPASLVLTGKTIAGGAFTPASVAAAGAVTGSNLSNTNTGDQTSVSGNAGTATALQTSRNFSLSGGGITSATVGFDGTAAVVLVPVVGAITPSSVASTGGITSSSASAGIGYATGAGGTGSQTGGGSNKTTGVTLNTVTGAVTMQSTALAAATIVSHTLTNSRIAANDMVILEHVSGGTSGAYTLNAFPGVGSAVISVRNNTAGSLSEAIVYRFAVIKSVNA